MQTSPARYKYYTYLVSASISVSLCANLIGAAKLTELNLPLFGLVSISPGIVLAPLFYMFGKIAFEVYGQQCGRRIMLASGGALLFAALLSSFMVEITPAHDTFDQEYQRHLEALFGGAYRIIAASMLALLSAGYVNGFVLERAKRLTCGRFLWARVVGAAVFCQFVDACVFNLVAFYGNRTFEKLIEAAFMQWSMKMISEIILAPVFCYLICVLQRYEGLVDSAHNSHSQRGDHASLPGLLSH